MTNTEVKMMRKAISKSGVDADKVMQVFTDLMEVANELLRDTIQDRVPVVEPPPVVDKPVDNRSDEPVRTLSLSSSLSIPEADKVETVDELYDRMIKDLPAIGQVSINGLGVIDVVTEPWKKFREPNSPTSDSSGFQVRLKNDRSVVIGKTMYFPGQPVDSIKDFRDILDSYVHRNSAERGPVRSVIPPSVNPDFQKSGMFAGDFAGGA